MHDPSFRITPQDQIINGTGAMLVVLLGFTSAFAVASIYALPVVLNAVGFGTGWVESLGYQAEPHRTLLLYVAGLCLAIGAVMLWFGQQNVHAAYVSEAETPPVIRAITFVGLVGGALLLLVANSCT